MSETTSRIFEFNDGKSSKFWEVTHSGSTVKVRFGKTGTNGQSQEKVFADEAAASKHVQKLISEKTVKGYVELGATPLTTVDVSGVAEVEKPTESKLEKTLTKPKSVKPANPKNPAQDPDATPESLMALLDKDDATNRLLARHPKASGELLEKLSHSSDKATRQAVASNPNTPPEIFVRLGQQFPKEFLANPVLDLLLLVNPALMVAVPESLLIRLLKQADCPASMLTWAAAHEQAKVQLAVAMNPNAPEQALQRLRESKHQAVQEAVQAKPGDTLEQDPEQAFEQAVKERIGSLKLEELEEAWASGDVGLAQWSALPLTFRLAKATNSDEFSPAAIAKLLRDTHWTLESLKNILPNYRFWSEVADELSTPFPLRVLLLEELSKDLSGSVRERVVANAFAPTPILDSLSRDPDSGVRRNLARNISASTSAKGRVLESLAMDSDYWVRREVAANQFTTAPVLAALSKDTDEFVQMNVGKNPATPATVLEILAKRSNSTVRSSVARNTSAPVHVLEALAGDSDRYVRLSVAWNPVAPMSLKLHLLEAFVNDTDKDVREMREKVARNPVTPFPVLEALSKDLNDSVRKEVATNPSTPASVLELLSEDLNLWVRSGVARNPSVPESVLLFLSEDSEDFVRSEVAKNASTPASVLVALSGNSDRSVRLSLAGNPSTPVNVLEMLSKDSDKRWGSEVRKCVAENPSTPPLILERLAGDSVGEVVTAVVSNPNTPLPVLIKLVKVKNLGVRQALATHAHRSPEIRQVLWQDTNDDRRYDVRRHVINCSELSGEMLDEMVQWAVLERDLVALLEHPNLSVSNAEWIADKLFNTPATSSAWYQRELARASAEVREAAQADAVLSYHGKDPNKAVLAKRPLAPVMALCAGPFIEPTRLVKVVGSTDWLVRAAVARNQGTPPNLLKKLSADAHPLVAALAMRATANQARSSQPSSSFPVQKLDFARAVTEGVARLRKVAGEEPKWLIKFVLDSAWGDQANVGEVVSALGWMWKFDVVFPLVCARLERDQTTLMWEMDLRTFRDYVRKVLAQSSECPVNVLRILANDKDIEVSFTAMDNKAFPPQEKAQIIQKLPELRGSRLMDVLRNPRAPLDLLEAKANNKDQSVRRAVAGNPSTPISVLEFMVKDSDIGVLDQLAGNPSTPVSVLEALSKNSTTDIRLSLVRNPSTPLHVLVRLLPKLANNRDAWIRHEVAENRFIPSNLLELLSKDSDDWVRENVAKNLSAPTKLLQSLSNDSNSKVRSGVAKNLSTPFSVLELLANDSEINVRSGVAENTSTPNPILELLAKDSEASVRRAVARNPSTPISVLELFAKDSDVSVLSGLASNPSTPAYLLSTLSLDSAWQVSVSAACNPSAPSEIWDQYIQSWVTRIQRAVLREQSIREGKAPTPHAPITPADLVRALTWLDCIPADADNKALTKASRSKDWLTRLGAALHPSATEGILKLLQQDSDPDVVQAANSRITNLASV